MDTPAYATGSVQSPGSPGGARSVSANGAASGSGIVWAELSTSQDDGHGLAAGILRAYNAETLQEIWNSEQLSSPDRLGTLVKFVPPVVANGKDFSESVLGDNPSRQRHCQLQRHCLNGQLFGKRSFERFACAEGGNGSLQPELDQRFRNLNAHDLNHERHIGRRLYHDD
jgi:hypothetical protein